MLQFIFRATLFVSIAGALLAVEFNSFHKASTVTPVQVSTVAAAPTEHEIAASAKKPLPADSNHTQAL